MGHPRGRHGAPGGRVDGDRRTVYDLAEADANRFYPFQTSAPYVRERGAQQYREVYDIIHPLQQPAKPRNLRLTPFFARHQALGAEFFTGAGWERPQWFRANRDRVGGVRHEWARRTGWAARGWSPEVGAEHLATRSDAAPLRHHAVREVRRRGARRARLPRACLREPDRPARGLDRLHRGAHPARRDPPRPHGDPQGRGAVPGDHGRWQRAPRPGLAAPADRRGGASSASRSARDRSSRWVCGAPRRATSCRR